MITLYDCATAPSPRRARILLAEKGVGHETIEVDLRKGEQLGDAYRQVNPQCTVPALRTDEGTVLTDNAGITAYLEARFPEPPLLGSTPLEKARDCELELAHRVRRTAGHRRGVAQQRTGHGQSGAARAGGLSADPRAGQRGLARVQQFFVTLNERLAGRDFIAADRFSVADITAVVAVDFARVVKVRPGEQHPHLQRWRSAMSQRPSMAL